MNDDSEIESLQKRLQIHTSNIHKLKIKEAHFGLNVPLDVQNSLEHEQRQKEIIEVALIAHETLKQISEKYDYSSDSEFLVPKSVVLDIIGVNNQILNLIAKQVQADNEIFDFSTRNFDISFNADQHLNDKIIIQGLDFRLEILVILISASLIQSISQSIMTTLVVTVIIWATFSIGYITFFIILTKYLRKKLMKKFNESKLQIKP